MMHQKCWSIHETFIQIIHLLLFGILFVFFTKTEKTSSKQVVLHIINIFSLVISASKQ